MVGMSMFIKSLPKQLETKIRDENMIFHAVPYTGLSRVSLVPEYFIGPSCEIF